MAYFDRRTSIADAYKINANFLSNLLSNLSKLQNFYQIYLYQEPYFSVLNYLLTSDQQQSNVLFS